MRRLMSACAAVSVTIGMLGVGGAQAAPSATGTAAAAGAAAVASRSVRADFNRDGFADLAVGAFGENSFRGVVNVIYGSARGLTARGNQYWTQDSAGIFGVGEAGDQFGWAVTAGDFDGDGFADLAVGVPGENSFQGAVNVIYGSTRGLTASGNQYWTQDSTGINGVAEAGDSFGRALAAADLGRSGQADLAVGAPGENSGRGAVSVIYGSAGGLTASGNQYWTQDSTGIVGTAGVGEAFGWSLAAANFGRSAYADLAVGVPADNGRGAVNVIYGSAVGLTGNLDQLWTQDSRGIAGTAAEFDLFGWSLAAANFGGSAQADLAVGAPNNNEFRGSVNVILGATRGLTAAGDQYWTQGNQGVRGTAESGDFFGTSLAAANFGKSAHADLAIGVPGEDRPVATPADSGRGAVNVLYGAARGLTASGNQYWTQDNPGIISTAEVNDEFGQGLAAGDFDGDGFADLAVGAAGENSSRGAVNVLYGSTRGLAAAGTQYWTQDSPGIFGISENNDLFGWASASGRSG